MWTPSLLLTEPLSFSWPLQQPANDDNSNTTLVWTSGSYQASAFTHHILFVSYALENWTHFTGENIKVKEVDYRGQEAMGSEHELRSLGAKNTLTPCCPLGERLSIISF